MPVNASNDPTCRAKDKHGHICTDKFGAAWHRPGVGPRPGTTCFYEQMARAEDKRQADALHAWADEVAQLTTLEQIGVL